jgi:hypothetical protein
MASLGCDQPWEGEEGSEGGQGDPVTRGHEVAPTRTATVSRVGRSVGSDDGSGH